MTIFAPVEEVRALVEEEILERYGRLEWIERGPVQHWATIWAEADDLVQLKHPRHAPHGAFTLVEFKGTGVDRVGVEGLRRLHAAIEARQWRWHGKRVDFAWDGSAISPALVDGWNRAGQFRSRTLNSGHCLMEHDGAGFRTAYLGLRVHHKPGMLRVYDKHGFNRVELELVDELADDAMRAVLKGADNTMSATAAGYLLRTVDYIDTTTGSRPARCKRIEAWSDFIGEAQKVKALEHVERPAAERILPIGRAEMWFQRNARAALQIIKALGSDYFLRRAEYYGSRRWTKEDDAAVEALSAFKESGLAGLPF